MVKEINWNTVLVILVIGVVGILLLSNSGILTGNVAVKATTGTLQTSDKQVVLNMLNSCRTAAGNIGENCNTVCTRIYGAGNTCVTSTMRFVEADGSVQFSPIQCNLAPTNGDVACRCCAA